MRAPITVATSRSTSSPRRCSRSSRRSPTTSGSTVPSDRHARSSPASTPAARSRPCYGSLKADVVREIAARDDIDLAQSTAYSDSHTDLAFLEAVGYPTAVNPDSKLEKIATERGWPILKFEHRHAG